jgi:hypothetical protein
VDPSAYHSYLEVQRCCEDANRERLRAEVVRSSAAPRISLSSLCVDRPRPVCSALCNRSAHHAAELASLSMRRWRDR